MLKVIDIYNDGNGGGGGGGDGGGKDEGEAECEGEGDGGGLTLLTEEILIVSKLYPSHYKGYL